MKVSFAFAFDFAMSLKTTHVSIDQRIVINTMIIIWVSLFFLFGCGKFKGIGLELT